MLPVPHTASLRVCIVLLGAHTHKRFIDGDEADPRHRIMHDSGHLRMSLDVPGVHLIERAPRCLCYAGPRPRPADGTNGAMHTLGGHMQLEVKQGHSGTRRDVGSYLLRAEPASGAFRFLIERSDLPTQCYLIGAPPPRRYVTSRNSCPRNALEVR